MSETTAGEAVVKGPEQEVENKHDGKEPVMSGNGPGHDGKDSVISGDRPGYDGKGPDESGLGIEEKPQAETPQGEEEPPLGGNLCHLTPRSLH